MYIRCLAAVAAASLMAGCAIHPVPEQVTGLKTEHIVKQIRCETRDAARQMILEFIKAAADRHDPYAQKLFDEYSENQDRMALLDPDHLGRTLPGEGLSQLRDAIKLIYSGAVAYAFELTMTETNNLGSTTNWLGLWQATLNLGLGVNSNRSRANKRSFTITDTLRFLLRDLNFLESQFDPYCNGHIAFGPNYIYPIAGRIGMYNTVHTFFQLAVFDGLAAKDSKPGEAGAPVMTDDLTFTTEFSVLPTPMLTFARVTTAFQVTDTALNVNFGRKDEHQVTVGVALAPKGKVALDGLQGWVFSGATAPANGRRGAPTTLVLNRVTASAATAAQALAVKAVDQIKSREIQLKLPPAP